MTAPGSLSAQQVAKVAADAGVDPRTVVRALEGRTKSLVVRIAIVRALRELAASYLATGDKAQCKLFRGQARAIETKAAG